MNRKSTHEKRGKKVKAGKKVSSERRRVEEELNTARAALNCAASGVLITDKKGRIKYVNPAFHRMFECQAPSFWSRSYESFIMTRGFPSPALGATAKPS